MTAEGQALSRTAVSSQEGQLMFQPAILGKHGGLPRKRAREWVEGVLRGVSSRREELKWLRSKYVVYTDAIVK